MANRGSVTSALIVDHLAAIRRLDELEVRLQRAPHRCLEVAPDANIAELCEAFCVLAHRFHPRLFARLDEAFQMRARNGYRALRAVYWQLIHARQATLRAAAEERAAVAARAAATARAAEERAAAAARAVEASAAPAPGPRAPRARTPAAPPPLRRTEVMAARTSTLRGLQGRARTPSDAAREDLARARAITTELPPSIDDDLALQRARTITTELPPPAGSPDDDLTRAGVTRRLRRSH